MHACMQHYKCKCVFLKKRTFLDYREEEEEGVRYKKSLRPGDKVKRERGRENSLKLLRYCLIVVKKEERPCWLAGWLANSRVNHASSSSSSFFLFNMSHKGPFKFGKTTLLGGDREDRIANTSTTPKRVHSNKNKTSRTSQANHRITR